MIIVIDNYDSFVQNLARYIRLCGEETHIIRNDEMSITDIAALAPDAIVISPGPCAPQNAGICIELIKQLGDTLPILGICLGHQAINEAYGGATMRGEPTHGRASAITHNGEGVFAALPSPMQGGRYHSLITDIPNNSPLGVIARDENDTVMAIQHKTNPVYGVQFHPESILTENGLALIQNFVRIAKDFQTKQAI